MISVVILFVIKFTSLPITDAFKLADYLYINELATFIDTGMSGVTSLQWISLLLGVLLISPLAAYVQAANCIFYEILIGNVEGKGVMSDVYDAMSIIEREEFIKNI